MVYEELDREYKPNNATKPVTTTYGNPVYTSNVRDSYPSTNTHYPSTSTPYYTNEPSTTYNSGYQPTSYSSQPYRSGQVLMETVGASGQGYLPVGDRLSHINTSYSQNPYGERVSHSQYPHATYGEGKVIQVNKGEPIVREIREGREGRNSVVLGSRVVGSKIVAEHYNTRIIGETFNHLAEIVIDSRPPAPRKSVRQQVQTYEDEPVFVEKFVDKEVEVLVERKVPRQVFIDVPYDVVVEQPIERIIQKEIEVEQVVEKIIEKDVEVPIEKIIEIPIEEVVEQRVELIKYVDVPVNRVITKQVEEHIENIVYSDKHIECDVADLHLYRNANILPTKVSSNQRDIIVPRPVFTRNERHNVIQEQVEKVVRVPKERVVEQIVENLITRPTFHSVHKENVIHMPIEKVIEKPVEHIIERPVYRRNLISRPYPVERIVEEIVQVHQEREVVQHVNVDIHQARFHNKVVNISKPVERVVNVDKKVVHDVMVPVTEIYARPFTLIEERPAAGEVVEHTEIEYLVHKQRPVPEEDIIEIAVPKFKKHMNVTEVEVPVKVLKITEQAVPEETEVIVLVENKIERPVYEEIVEHRNVIVNKECIEYYDVIREKIIEVEREEDVEVSIKTRVQNPVENYQTLEERVAVDRNVIEPVKGRDINEGGVEITDSGLEARIRENKEYLNELFEENRKLKAEFKRFEGSVRGLNTNEYNSFMRQLADLRAQRSELQSRISIMIKDTDRLMHTSNHRALEKTQVSYRTLAPEVHSLKNRLEALVNENRHLVNQAKSLYR